MIISNKLFRNETIVFYIDFILNCLIPFCCCPVWCICEENKKIKNHYYQCIYLPAVTFIVIQNRPLMYVFCILLLIQNTSVYVYHHRWCDKLNLINCFFLCFVFWTITLSSIYTLVRAINVYHVYKHTTHTLTSNDGFDGYHICVIYQIEI